MLLARNNIDDTGKSPQKPAARAKALESEDEAYGDDDFIVNEVPQEESKEADKKKKDKKKADKKRSSSSGSSSSSDSDKKKKKEKKEKKSVMFNTTSVVNTSEKTTIMKVSVNEALNKKVIDELENRVQRLSIELEVLQDEVEVYKRKEEDEKKSQGLGQIQATVNNALYKKKYEELVERLDLQQKEFNRQITEKNIEIVTSKEQIITAI